MNKILELLKSNKYAQFGLTLLVGGVIGAVLGGGGYTKTSVEKMKSDYELKITELSKQHEEETSSLKQSLEVAESSSKSLLAESSKKIESLTTENTHLKMSSKQKKYKLIKPDGTIIEKEYNESNSESTTEIITEVRQEFNEKVQSIENTWKQIHEEKVAELKSEFDSELAKAKSEVKTVEVVKEVTVTKKSLRPEIGVNTQKDLYLHASYPLLGPVTVGAGFSGNQTHFGEFHVGIGLDL